MDGVINIYKEKGYTSHDVVAKLRGILKQKKIGHTGTLDPDATGVLPVCIGSATKLCDMLTDHSKTYRTVFLIGKTTDTQDLSGRMLTEADAQDVVNITEEQMHQTIMEFTGSYDQVPPMYSARKVNGKKLYELARAGIEVERKAKTVEISQINIMDMKLPYVTMEVTCSKGTYIRTLCHDIGQRLGVGAVMTELIRTRVERFLLEDALTLAEVENCVQTGTLAKHVIPVEDMFTSNPKIVIPPSMDRLLMNGNRLPLQEAYPEQTEVRIYDSDGVFRGIYRKEQDDYCPVKMFLGSLDS